MTKEEILLKIEEAKKNSMLSEKAKEQVIAMYHEKLTQLLGDPKIFTKDERNVAIVKEFYESNQTFVSKEELLTKGFDFSQWFSTSDLRHFFDVEENSFEYKDFMCGGYYIKTRDKNIEIPNKKARLFFQIIKLEYDRNTGEFKRAIKLLRDRKFAAGHLWAYSFDMDMSNPERAKRSQQTLLEINTEIAKTLPQLKQLINSLTHTLNVYTDLYERLEKKETEDEQWV